NINSDENDNNETHHHNILEHFIEVILYDLFIIMNISTPSSFDLYSAKIDSNNSITNQRIELSNARFEMSLLDSMEHGWPHINNIDIFDVRDWYLSSRRLLSMTPKGRMEKVLFALLHISRTHTSEMTVIFIFYALESLFDTKTGENFRTL